MFEVFTTEQIEKKNWGNTIGEYELPVSNLCTYACLRGPLWLSDKVINCRTGYLEAIHSSLTGTIGFLREYPLARQFRAPA